MSHIYLKLNLLMKSNESPIYLYKSKDKNIMNLDNYIIAKGL